MSGMEDLIEAYGEPELVGQLRRLRPKNYDEFNSQLYADLDVLVGYVEADAKDFTAAGEDVLNRELVRLLKARCYIASHDHDEGGHVDVHVRSRGDQFSWLGEAKLDNGPAYLTKGVSQLTERYARGTPGHNCGGFLVYVQKKRVAERFAKWKDHLAANAADYEGLTFDTCPTRAGLAFFTEFVLPRMGEGVPKYRIRHLAVSAFREASEEAAAAA